MTCLTHLRLPLIIGLPLGLSGCPGYADKEDGPRGNYNGTGIPGAPMDTGEGEGEGETGETGELEQPDVQPVFESFWEAEDEYEEKQLYIRSSRGALYDYHFGLVSTDPDDRDPWYGEDCYIGVPDEHDGEMTVLCKYTTQRDEMIITTGGDRESAGNSNTAFTAAQEHVMTYVAWFGGYKRGQCFSWGHDTSYYDDAGCIPIDD